MLSRIQMKTCPLGSVKVFHTKQLPRNITTSRTSRRTVPILNEPTKPTRRTSSFAPIQTFFDSPVRGAGISTDKEVLSVHFGGEENLDFPSIWLRDNCNCNECYDHNAQSRLIDQQFFSAETVPTSVKVEENKVKIIWDDGHRSEYDKNWLCRHSFHKEHQQQRETQFHELRQGWGNEKFPNIFKTYPYEGVMNDDKILLDWLQSLAKYGVSMVTGAPLEDSTVRDLANKIAFIRNTLYGEIFQVKSQEGASNTAYKKGQLQMHSDMPFYRNLPGTIFLHCIVQSRNGGENLLVDGINAANQLDEEHYRALAETVVNWSDIGSDKNFYFHSLNREPCICEDKLGNIEKINWSQPQRDTRFDVSIPESIKWYKAMVQYSRLLHSPKNAITLKTGPGDILTIDNRRIMHSRANYSDGARHLNGVYMDWDEIYPKIRVLRKKLNV